MENEPTKRDESISEQELGSEKTDVSINDVFALLSGTATLETRKRVARAMYDPHHPLSYLARQSSSDGEYQADWPPKDAPDAIRDLLSD